MSRLSKVLSLTVVIVFLLACNFVTQPINDAQNLAQTAQAVASSLPVETLQAAATAIASAIPQETIQAAPSMIPSLEAFASAMPDIGNMLDPQGTPVQEWRGVPVMPEATAGQEFSANNTYSYKANATSKGVQDFYNHQMEQLGWEQPFSTPFDAANGGVMVFRKEQSSLAITVMPSENAVLVLLVLTQA